MDKLEQHIESLIFSAEQPLGAADIQNCLTEAFGIEFDLSVIEAAIQAIHIRYQSEVFSFELQAIAGGFQFLTKAAFHPTIGAYLRQLNQRKLSRAALETLAIIAYKQPISKSDLEKIRGVSCDYTIQKLLEKELVSIEGRSEGPGRPLLYGTSMKFMDYFGLKDLNDLPKPKELKEPENAIGDPVPIDEIHSEEE
ncbi:MAG TPA: SMC-Scp complex subunit ScpB [Saprospiraceae bacterium]|nr:SMC-Scp complex subunit ScpB [Saprospiraceae bacterium]HMQ84952.1 SMC-Scp complex subunit ScpB [Saprospiraceae bacterium]